MPILGIEAVTYGVDDVARSARFFEDFGLPQHLQDAESTIFKLETGSRVIVRHADDPALPKPHFAGNGVRETIWGVDSSESLERLVSGLQIDREVSRDADGTARFYADDGMALGLRVWNKRTPVSAPDPVNAPGLINRLNQHRKWRRRAIPKMINHVVFTSADYIASFRFFQERLNFRLSDHSPRMGAFARPDGAFEHHSIFWQNAHYRGAGSPGFEHTAFGVEDLDEMMVGANYMMRKGWNKPGKLAGLARHRIGSGLFYYVECPAGGDVEYLADADCLDDRWIPRVWSPKFGVMAWGHNPSPFTMDEYEWDVRLDPDGASLDQVGPLARPQLATVSGP